MRVGKKNQPSFRIIVTEKTRGPKSGRFVEKVGFYNPLTKERKVNAERIKYWMSVGAKLSATVHNLLISEKIIEGKKIPMHKQKPAEVSAEKEEVKGAEAPSAAPTPGTPEEKAPDKQESAAERSEVEHGAKDKPRPETNGET